MKQTITKIDYDWLTRPTGDPFADVGGYVIRYFSEKHPEKDIFEIIEFITKIYVIKWGGKLHGFFHGSKITNPAIKDNEEKIKGTLKYFHNVIDEIEYNDFGFCRISGRKTKLYRAGRDNSIMTGSGAFINFHHAFQSGMMFSKEMLIRMFFIPFGSILVGGKAAIIISNNDEINNFFVEKICKSNNAEIASLSSEGVLKSEYGNPVNAIFSFVDDIFTNRIKEIKDDTIGVYLSLFHFTNFGASSEINIHKLPASTFRFYSTCQNLKLKTDWQSFLLSHYTNSKFKGAKYNNSTSNYELTKKEDTEQIGFNDYKTWRNIILENLLNGKSILQFFVKWGIKHKFNFTIVELYQIHIQGMKQETLNKIKELALFLTNAEEDVIKKSIKAIDGYKSSYELRRFFLKNVVVKNYNNGAKEAIITMDDLVYYLFPDDVSWRDIRDILLFAIYQELHNKNILIETELSNSEIEETIIENNLKQY